MPSTEKKTEINAPVEIVYGILSDGPNFPKWNITVKDIEELEENKFSVKSTVGDFISNTVELVENEKISQTFEGTYMSGLDYFMTPKGDKCEVTIKVGFDKPEQEAVLGVAGEMLLDSLKKYAEYLQSGGNPDEFKK